MRRVCGAVRDPGSSALEKARTLLRSADAIVVAAGAGMSADSGLPTFRGDGGFWGAYPALGRRGLAFTSVASPATFAREPRLAWGFYGHRLALYRETPPHDGYRLLMDLALRVELGAFVVTTNVDGHFRRAGFAGEAIWEMHGSIHRLQCLDPCCPDTWPAVGFGPRVDARECRLEGELPRCPACGGLARPNVLMFSDWSWVSDPADAQERHFEAFVARAARPVVLELGAGTAIPSLRNLSRRRRWPVVRVNVDDADVPDGEGVGLRMGTLEALRRLATG